jgi:hypothetical protein
MSARASLGTILKKYGLYLAGACSLTLLLVGPNQDGNLEKTLYVPGLSPSTAQNRQ